MAADPLQEHMDAVERLAGLIAGDDDQRFLLVFQSLANLVDGFLTSSGDAAVEHARSLLLRSAERHLARAPRGPRAAASPTATAGSVFADPVFLHNSRKLIKALDGIVGGVPTADFPDCVAVGGDGGWCCSGTLVAPNVVVTAGHCVAGGCCTQVFVGEDVGRPADGQVIPVRDAVAHPDYEPPHPTHDLSVLILAEAAEVAPRRIGDATTPAAATVRLAGFGNTDVFSSGGYGRRRMVDVPIASPNPEFGADPETEFVAGAPFLDRDSCNGDSGGPAYVQVGDDWLLAGATSRATASAFRPCGDGGIYTRVDVFEDWVRSVPGGQWPAPA
jgi:Trypsin